MIAGGIFHDDVEGGRAGVTLSVVGSVVRGKLPDGRRFDIDGRASTFTHGGDSGRWAPRPTASGGRCVNAGHGGTRSPR